MQVENPTSVGLVILTTGNRPDDLRAIMTATAAMPFDERIVVGNGSAAPNAEGWRAVDSPTNLGVPGGRSFGIGCGAADIVIFLDDDSSVSDRSVDLVDEVRAVFDSDASIGALAFRVVVAGTDTTLRRWSPTPSSNARDERSDVPTFPGNGHALRRSAFEAVGGYLDELFFKHEETELSWRLIDAGWRVVTDPAIVVEHPDTTESRHERALELGLRNKIWISRLRLPVVVAATGSFISTLRSLMRCRSGADLRAIARGLRQGFGPLPASRAPVTWATVTRLTRSGRPPIF